MKQNIEIQSVSDTEKAQLAQSLEQRAGVEKNTGGCGGSCGCGGGVATAKIYVQGLTCDHCVATVTETLEEFDGVSAVQVELNVGEASVVTFNYEGDVSPVAIREALADAGYAVVQRS